MARTAIGSPVNAKSAVSTYPRVERSAASRATFRVRLGYWPSTIDQRGGEPERADGGLLFISKPRAHAGIAEVLSARAAVYRRFVPGEILSHGKGRNDEDWASGLARGLVQIGRTRATAATAQMLAQRDRRAVVTEALNIDGGIEHPLVLAPPTYRNQGHLVVDKLTESAARRSFTDTLAIGAHGCYRRAPGHFGRNLGSMNSPRKRALKSSAWPRSAKQKTIMSASSRRKECVRGHRESGSQNSWIVT